MPQIVVVIAFIYINYPQSLLFAENLGTRQVSNRPLPVVIYINLSYSINVSVKKGFIQMALYTIDLRDWAVIILKSSVNEAA